MLRNKIIVSALLICSSLPVSSGCRRPPNEENVNAAAANLPPTLTQNNPYYQAGLKGDVERLQVTISSAQMNLQQERWQEVLTDLKKAGRDVDTAIKNATTENNAFIRASLEDLKAAIERTTNSAQQHSAQTQAQLSELITRIGAMKVNMP